MWEQEPLIPCVPKRKNPLLDSRLGWSLTVAPGLVGTCLSWGLNQGQPEERLTHTA